MDTGVDAMSSLLSVAASPLLQAANATAASTMTSSTGSASGNMLLDALLLGAVPFCLQFLLSPEGLKDAWKRIRTALIGDEDAGFVFRDIKATTTFGEYYVQNEDENRHGHLLQKAILTHLADVLQSQLRGKDIRYEMVERELDDDKALEVEETKAGLRKSSDDWSDNPDQSEQYDAINRLCVGSVPKLGEWIEVQPKVFFQQCAESSDDDSGNDKDDSGSKIATGRCKDVTSLFRFKSNAVDGTKKIDKLIEEAFVKFQLLELTKLANDTKKYMYVQTHKVAKTAGGDDDNDNSGGGDGSSTTTTVVYKRYALGEEKTFRNLFFEEKTSLVQLLDNFMAHSGKFAIKGFPYKLGLLLHGPPGTGKTSLIKAVAQHTKRHIVTISLGKIQTNQELMNALFDLRFTVEGVALPVNMTFEDIVFVMEDIDCAASVVMARENKAKSSSTRSRYKRSSQWSSSSASDKLNLSGLLNVLDGVIDCPGRIVIMTTNHPEKLDPALIRPGRVNKKLELGYMSRANIQSMIEYYSQEKCTNEQEGELDRIVCAENAKKITPATVEALSAEFDDIDSVLNALHLLQNAQESSESWMS